MHQQPEYMTRHRIPAVPTPVGLANTTGGFVEILLMLSLFNDEQFMR
jgi:hypothetical protein